jgi:glycosyltransferase involved in cell wall biosynthesis
MSGGDPRISVVTATFNRAGRLERLLEGLRRQTLSATEFEVVVVDDASADTTRRLLEATEADGTLPLHAIYHERNTGRAQAREDGWREARAELIAFTDDDCVPAPDWLEAALRASTANPGTIVQGRTDPDPAELDRLGPFARTISVTAYDAGLQTCNIVYPRRTLEAVGGFDTEAFGRVHGSEDSDLGWRAIEHEGARVVFADDVRVHHAVNQLGPVGKLRLAAGWSMLAYARHPELRRAHFARGPFWKPTHLWLARALAAALLPRRLWPLSLWLLYPYARSVYARGKLEGGGVPLAPYFVLYDLAELRSALRESVRHRTLMI